MISHTPGLKPKNGIREKMRVVGVFAGIRARRAAEGEAPRNPSAKGLQTVRACVRRGAPFAPRRAAPTPGPSAAAAGAPPPGAASAPLRRSRAPPLFMSDGELPLSSTTDKSWHVAGGVRADPVGKFCERERERDAAG